MRHYIDLTDQALLQIMLNSIEAYVLIHHKQKTSGIEMHGHFFGNTEKTSTTTRHKIEFFSADTSAKMKPDFCIPHEDCISLKSEITRCFSNYHLLGALHTHPYLEHEIKSPDQHLKFMRTIGCEFSNDDRSAFFDKLSQSGADYLIEGVFAINHRPRKSFEGDGKLDENLFEFSMGNLKCFIKIQVFSLDSGALIDVPTILKCKYLEKFSHIRFSYDFGRIKIKENNEYILEYKP